MNKTIVSATIKSSLAKSALFVCLLTSAIVTSTGNSTYCKKKQVRHENENHYSAESIYKELNREFN